MCHRPASLFQQSNLLSLGLQLLGHLEHKFSLLGVVGHHLVGLLKLGHRLSGYLLQNHHGLVDAGQGTIKIARHRLLAGSLVGLWRPSPGHVLHGPLQVVRSLSRNPAQIRPNRPKKVDDL